MEPVLELELEGGADAPARARAALRTLNGELGDLYEDVSLLVSELVTNAVVHAKSKVVRLVVLFKARQDFRVEVASAGPLWEPPAEPRPGPLGGFGFFFVEQLAQDWGIVREGPETRVWFDVAPGAGSG
jgi:anti-sigma regulatory factor (Ser/Thr protein kinase)